MIYIFSKCFPEMLLIQTPSPSLLSKKNPIVFNTKALLIFFFELSYVVFLIAFYVTF